HLRVDVRGGPEGAELLDEPGHEVEVLLLGRLLRLLFGAGGGLLGVVAVVVGVDHGSSCRRGTEGAGCIPLAPARRSVPGGGERNQTLRRQSGSTCRVSPS